MILRSPTEDKNGTLFLNPGSTSNVYPSLYATPYQLDPGFRKRVPLLSSVGERKIMNHFVTAGQYLAQTVQAVQTIQSGVIRRFFIHGLERLERWNV